MSKRKLLAPFLVLLIAIAAISGVVNTAFASCESPYTVQPGDGWIKIADICDTNESALKQLNTTLLNSRGDNLQVGDVLQIPNGQGNMLTPTAYPTPTDTPDPRFTPTATPTMIPIAATTVARMGCPNPYVVQPGDSLSKIARDAGISPVGVYRANRLDQNGVLQVGETVCRVEVLAGVAATNPQSAAIALAPVIGKALVDAAAVTIVLLHQSGESDQAYAQRVAEFSGAPQAQQQRAGGGFGELVYIEGTLQRTWSNVTPVPPLVPVPPPTSTPTSTPNDGRLCPEPPRPTFSNVTNSDHVAERRSSDNETMTVAGATSTTAVLQRINWHNGHIRAVWWTPGKGYIAVQALNPNAAGYGWTIVTAYRNDRGPNYEPYPKTGYLNMVPFGNICRN